MSETVSILAAVNQDDEHVIGEYDDDRYAEAEVELQRAVTRAVAAGIRTDALEQAIENGLSEAGVD